MHVGVGARLDRRCAAQSGWLAARLIGRGRLSHASSGAWDGAAGARGAEPWGHVWMRGTEPWSAQRREGVRAWLGQCMDGPATHGSTKPDVTPHGDPPRTRDRATCPRPSHEPTQALI
jgi:hypothetical protein